jgi:hypothetical protein
MTPKEWAMTWKKAGVALDKVKTQELSAMTMEDTQKKISTIFDGVDPSYYLGKKNSRTSGLVEMQKCFSKLKLKLNG